MGEWSAGTNVDAEQGYDAYVPPFPVARHPSWSGTSEDIAKVRQARDDEEYDKEVAAPILDEMDDEAVMGNMTNQVMKQEIFMEIFAGVGGLSEAVARAGGKVYDPVDSMNKTYTEKVDFDLTRPEDYKKIATKIKSGSIKWVTSFLLAVRSRSLDLEQLVQ